MVAHCNDLPLAIRRGHLPEAKWEKMGDKRSI
jgi:hypothetical protein